MKSKKEIIIEYFRDNPLGEWDGLDIKILMQKAQDEIWDLVDNFNFGYDYQRDNNIKERLKELRNSKVAKT